MKQLRVYIASLLLVLGLPLLVSTAAYAQFNPLEQACEASTGTPEEKALCVDSAEDTDPVNTDDGLIVKAANVLAIAAGVIAVIIIVIAGITMTLSQGDPAKVKSSRDAIIYAAIGIVVVLLARTIVVFIMFSLRDQ